MRKNFFHTLFSILLLISCNTKTEDTYVADHYNKQEVTIAMRDGVKLHTTIYTPKDTSKTYPILLQRTPYSAGPYGEGKMKNQNWSKCALNERRKHCGLPRCSRALDE